MQTRLLAASLALGSLALAGCGGYRKSGDRWVFVTLDEGRGRQEHALEGADPATFEVLAPGEYARDARNVWHRMTRIPDADARTFTVLAKALWVKDRSHVWVRDVPVRGADAATFRPLEFPYARDASHVFCGTMQMPVADPAPFEVVAGSRSTVTYFLADGMKGLGYGDVGPVDQAHPLLIGDGQARDGRFHYFGPVAVAGADYASFRILNEVYARDRAHVFYKHQTVPGADPETFVADHGFGKDKAHHYAGTMVLGAR